MMKSNEDLIYDIKNLQIIHSLLECVLDKYKFISYRANEYDFNNLIKANGYRTHIKIGMKIFGNIDKLINHLEENSKILNTFTDKSTKIKQWRKLLVAFYPIVCAVLKFINCNKTNLLLPKDHNLNKIFLHYPHFLHKCGLYSSLLGFQFEKNISVMLSMYSSTLASFGKVNKNQNSITKNFKRVRSSSSYFINPNKRVKSMKKFLISPSIETFQKFFSFLEKLDSIQIKVISSSSSLIYKPIDISITNLCIRMNNEKEINVFDYDFIKELLKISELKVWVMQPIKNIEIYHNENKKYNDNLIFYIHGGGFVSFSTNVCYNFHKELCKDLEAIIYSIDYTLSPKAKFPTAIHECFYAYCWVLCNNKEIGWSGKKIILSGDSAGGNLLLAVVQMTIDKNIRIPDGCVCLYPLCCASYVQSPSRLVSYIDPIISSGFLTTAQIAYFGSENTSIIDFSNKTSFKKSYNGKNKTCIKNKYDLYKFLDIEENIIKLFQTKDCYDSDSEDEEIKNVEYFENDISQNPLASPLNMEDSIVRKFPPIRMIFSDLDPFLDENIEMSKMFLNNKIDIKIELITDLPHGFINFLQISCKEEILRKRISNSFQQLFLI